MKGAFAALTDRAYVLDNYLLNQPLVAYGSLEKATGFVSGFALHHRGGLRTTAPSMSAPGTIQRVDLTNWQDVITPVRMIEAPLLVDGVESLPVGQTGETILPSARTLMVPANRNSFVSPSAPDIFQTASVGPDTGLATLYRTVNNEPVTLSNPIHPEDLVVIYVTGLGRTSPGDEIGAPAPADPLAHATIQPSVKLGGLSLPVLYAGLVPGQVGVYQINVYVPPEVPRGMDVALVISRPGGDLTLSVRVVK